MKKIASLLVLLLLIQLMGCAAGGSQPEAGTSGAPAASGAPGETADNTEDNENNVLTIANISYPNSLDIQYVSDFPSIRPGTMIFETLVTFNPQGEIYGVLAESYEFKDAQTLYIKLREGVQFHNGDEMTAKDVQWSLTRAIHSPHVSSKADFIDETKFNIIGDYEIEIGFHYPMASALALLTEAGNSILPSELYQDAETAEISANPIGTGPYKYVSSTQGDNVTFERFDGYWGEPAKIKNLQWKTITEAGNRTIELETGGVHFAYDILPNDIAKIEENPDLTMLIGPYFFVNYVCYNTQKAPFDDPAVRRALGMGVDKEAILEGVYNGYGRTGIGPMTWTTPYRIEDFDNIPQFDIEAGKQALADAGYPDGLELNYYVYDNQPRLDTAQIVMNSWAQMGVKVNLVTVDYAQYFEVINSGEFDVCTFGWVANGDPDYTLNGIFHSSMVGASNYSHTINPEIDRLLEEGRKTIDEAERAKVYEELQRVIFDYYPVTWYWEAVNMYAQSNLLAPIEYSPYNIQPWLWDWR